MIVKEIYEVLHIYNETLYINTDIKASYDILKGSFQQKILIIFSKEDDLIQNIELLDKMLIACKLNESDFQIIKLNNSSNLFQIINELNPETLILFGLTLDNEIFSIQKNINKPFRFKNIKMLISNSLTEINNNPVLKSSLWSNGLKPLFNII